MDAAQFVTSAVGMLMSVIGTMLLFSLYGFRASIRDLRDSLDKVTSHTTHLSNRLIQVENEVRHLIATVKELEEAERANMRASVD